MFFFFCSALTPSFQVELFFSSYKEPDTSTPQNLSKPIVNKLEENSIASVLQQSSTVSLGKGVLTRNLGIPIIVACCKVRWVSLNFSTI